MKDEELEKVVDKQLKEIQKHQPFPESTQCYLDIFYQVELSYTSTGLENFNLTRPETASVVSGLLQINHKTLEDVLAVADHIKAVQLMMLMARSNSGWLL